ncbi:MAG: sulfatase-like hydrolase/transferase [Bacteroidota bacterium]
MTGFGRSSIFAQAKSYAFLLFALSLPFLIWILLVSPPAEGGVALLYKASLPAYFALLLFLGCFLLAPLHLLPPRGWPLPLFGSLWLVFLVADSIVFNGYKFHINLFLLQFLFVDFQGLGLPKELIAGGLIAVLLIIAFAIFLSRLAARNIGWLEKLSSLTVAATLVLFVINQAIHAWADTYRRQEITQYTTYFPLYFPIGSRKAGESVSRLLPGLFPAEEGSGTLGGTAGQHVNYPLAAPAGCTPGSDANIMFIVLESWQAASLTPEIMPNLAELRKMAWDFRQHISGGNATVPGLFSLMFGLHASYYDAFRANPRSNPSAFTQTLDRLGYRSQIFTSVDLTRFSLQALFFPNIAAADVHQFNDRGNFRDSDRATVERLVDSLGDKSRQDGRHFDFMFLTSSHFAYEYPDEFRKFTPVPEHEGSNLLNKNTDPTPILNDYHNSLYYEDHLLGKIFAKLRQAGLWDKTWIVVLGDHAEEFNENGLGYWGHGSNFSRWQTQTPLLIKAPGQKAGQTRDTLSTHQDIVPTLVEEALACPGPSEKYSTGSNLFRGTAKAGTVIASYVTAAYWVDGSIAEKLAVGSGYAWRDLKEKRPMPPAESLKKLIAEESRFLR